MSDDAKVRVGLEGSREAEQRLKDLKGEFKSFGSEIGRVADSALNSFASLAMSLTKVDPGSAAERFRSFRASVTEMSITAGTSIDKLKSRFHDLGAKNLLPQDQLASFSSALAKSTHDFGDSSKALDALRAHGLVAGKSLEEMGPIAEILKNKMNLSFEQIPDALGKIAGAAEKIGTTGGPAALQDQFTALGDTISQISTKGSNDLAGLVGVMAGIGKGKSPEQAAHLQQQLIHQMGMGNEQSRLNLGVKEKDWYGEDGRFKVTANNVSALRDFYIKRSGSQSGALRQARRIMDPQLAFALFGKGSENLVGTMREAEGAAPSSAAAGAIAKLAASEHGQDLSRKLTRDEREREELGKSTNRMQQGVSGFMPTNPYGSAAILGVSGMVGSMVSGYATRKTFEASAKALSAKMLGVSESAGEATAGLTGMGSSLVKQTALLGTTFAAFYALGSWLDNKFHISDSIANGLTDAERRKADAKASEEVQDAKVARLTKIKEFERSGLTHVQAVYRADHATGPLPPAKVEVHVHDDSGHPNRVTTHAKHTSSRPQ